MDAKQISHIQIILEKFQEKKAKTWELGTNFYMSWTLLAKTISQKFLEDENFKKNYIKIVRVDDVLVKGLYKKRYQLQINGENVTPISKKNKSASSSAIRQYLQVGGALNMINFGKREKIEEDQFFYLTPNFWELAKDPDSLDDFLLFSLIKSVNSNISFERNLGFSLFLSMLEEKNQKENFFKLFQDITIKPRTFKNKKAKSFLPGKLSEKKVIEFIQHVKGVKTESFGNGKNTYIEASKKLIDKYSFKKILNAMEASLKEDYLGDIFDEIINNKSFLNIPERLLKEKEEKSRQLNLFRKEIDSNRSKLRDSIIFQRVEDTKNHFDIENSPHNKGDITTFEACHIFDIWRLKKLLKYLIEKKENNEKIQQVIDDAKNPNNGILLDRSCHLLFDREEIWFDSEGYLMYKKESEKQVKKYFGEDIGKIHIKKEFFNEEMKFYFSKRI